MRAVFVFTFTVNGVGSRQGPSLFMTEGEISLNRVIGVSLLALALALLPALPLEAITDRESTLVGMDAVVGISVAVLMSVDVVAVSS